MNDESFGDKVSQWAFTFGAAHILDKVTKAATAKHGKESLTVSLLRELGPEIVGQTRNAFFRETEYYRRTEYYGPASQRRLDHHEPPQQQIGYHPGNQEAEAYFRAAVSLMQSENYEGALKALQSAASLDHPEAQYMLGAMYAGMKDYAQAETWLAKAARNGHAEAGKELSQVMVAKAAAESEQKRHQQEQQRKQSIEECFARGQEMRDAGNHAEAIRCLKTAADAGHLEATTSLGLCYYKGEGVAQDYGEAIDWFMRAASAGEGNAMNYVGTCHAFGRGLPKNYTEAADWWRMAADRGIDGAQYNLGIAYLKGHGVGSDRQQALHWFRLAATQGHVKAREKAIALGGAEEARSHHRREEREQSHHSNTRSGSGRMTRQQALEMLDLKEGATKAEIRAAYTRIMQQVHPDKGGSNFFAKQLNEAREILLND